MTEKKNAGDLLADLNDLGDEIAQTAVKRFGAKGHKIGVSMFLNLEDENGMGLSRHTNLGGIDSYIVALQAINSDLLSGTMTQEEIDQLLSAIAALAQTAMGVDIANQAKKAMN